MVRRRSAAVGTGSSGTAFINSPQHFSSHSLLLSLELQFRGSATSAAAPAASASAASAATSGDADVPGWFGNPGNGHLPGAAASAATAASGAGTRLLSIEPT